MVDTDLLQDAARREYAQAIKVKKGTSGIAVVTAAAAGGDDEKK